MNVDVLLLPAERHLADVSTAEGESPVQKCGTIFGATSMNISASPDLQILSGTCSSRHFDEAVFQTLPGSDTIVRETGLVIARLLRKGYR